MPTLNNGWKVCLVAGAGLALGALGALSLTRKNGSNSGLRKTCVSLLSHGLDLKDKVSVATGIAKENLEDVVAEARYESDIRKMQATEPKESQEDLEVTSKAEEIIPSKKAGSKQSAKKTSRKTS